MNLLRFGKSWTLQKMKTGVMWSCIMLLCSSSVGQTSGQRKWFEEKYFHRLKPLDEPSFRSVAADNPNVNFEKLLDPLLIPRVPGTEGHRQVRQYIKGHLKDLGWHIESDGFEDQTPHGKKRFENIIATLNPEAPRRLVLACHFDSKYSKDYEFIGATDSAVPCAMLLHLAYTLKDSLDMHKNRPDQNVTLQLVFFDGEEAFVRWGPDDSIYGARHLARKWENTPYPPQNTDGTNMLNRIDVLVLLDLLGTKGAKIPSYFSATSHWHGAIIDAEQALKRSRNWSGQSRAQVFHSRPSNGYIEDDHIPFLVRNVDVIHVIPSPFPSVWHTQYDDKYALDFDSIDNLNRIFRLFVTRYLDGYPGNEPTNPKNLPDNFATLSAHVTPSSPSITNISSKFLLFLSTLVGQRLQ